MYTSSTDKDSSFYLQNVMKFSTGLLLKSMHQDWYICQSRNKHTHSTPLELDFYNGDPDVLERCTFSFWPIPQYENKQKNCRNVAGPVVQPAIVGQPLPHPARLVAKMPSTRVPVQPSCIPLCSSGGSVGETPGEPATYGSTGLGGPLQPSVAGRQSINICFTL